MNCVGMNGTTDNESISVCVMAWCHKTASLYDDVIKWKHFPRYCPFVGGIHTADLLTHSNYLTILLLCQTNELLTHPYTLSDVAISHG